MREGITKGGRNGWREGERNEGFFKGREGEDREGGMEGESEGERGRLLRREGGREEGRVLQSVGYMGGRMKIGMEGITEGVGRQAGYYKWREGGSEGGMDRGRENITNERIETVISAISNIYDVMAWYVVIGNPNKAG